MRHIHFHHRMARIGIVLLVLVTLVSMLVLGATPRSFANDAWPTDRPQTPLVPNSEPEPGSASTMLSNTTMLDTVEAVAAAFNQLPQPATAPEGALSGMDATAPEAQAPALASGPVATNWVYLPLVRGGAAPGSAPDPTVTPTTTPTTTPTPEPEPAANVAVAIWATPSVYVARDGTLAYEIRLANYGNGPASGTRVVFPYNRQQYTFTNTKLDSQKGDWVSAIGQDTITVNFGRLAAGERRVGTLYFKVAKNLADNTVISVRSSFEWSDSQNGGRAATNWAPVLVGSVNSNSQWVWLEVKPTSGKAGTVHKFFTDRFIPGERVTTWLNTPSGVRALNLTATADGYGRVWLDFASTGLTPGNYSLVVYGNRSQLTAVAAFVVQP